MLGHRLSTRLMLFLHLMAMLAVPALGAAAGPVAAGPSKAVIAIGSGRIIKNNTANARQEAINNSLDVAVAMAVAELVPEDTLVGHFPAVSRVTSGRSNEFLQGYKVLAETPAGNDYRVVVSATVSLDALRRQFTAAGIPLSRKAMPRTLLFVVEKNVLQQVPFYWWGGDAVMMENDSQKVVTAKLREAGFPVLEPSRPDGGGQVLDYPPDIEMETLMLLAADYRAEVVVVGTARAALASNTMGEQLRSYRAVVGVKAIRVADRKIIATVEEASVATANDDTQGGRKALDVAAVQSGETLAGQLAAAWLVSEDVLNRVEIAIEGTRELANFVSFRRVIKKMPGVKSTQTTEMKPDQATLVVEYQGDVSALAESLMRTTFENFGIDIKDVSGEKMRVALRPK